MKKSKLSKEYLQLTPSFTEAAKPEEKPEVKYPAPLCFRPKNEEERQLVLAAARGSSVSEYIRKCVLGENAPPKKRKVRVPVKNEQTLSHVLALLGQSHIANNLNQLAYHANTGSLMLDEENHTQIKEAYEHVLEMREALVAALGLKESSAK